MNLTLTCRLGLLTSSSLSFSPASLFAAGESGYWLDPSDFSTMWQDSQGVTPVTATGQTCGLILDKRIGTRTQVFDDANVTFSGTAGYAGRVSPGVYEYARDASGIGTVFFGGLTTGRTYLVSVQISAYAGSIPGITNIRTDYAYAGLGNTRPFTNSAGVFTFFFLADGAYFRITTGSLGAGGTISNVSILEVPGNHFLQATAGNRPILGVEPAGGRRNLLTFTEQFDNAAWAKSSSTNVAPNVISSPNGDLTADIVRPNAGTAITTSALGLFLNASVYASQGAALAAGDYTYSCYVKGGASFTHVQLRVALAANLPSAFAAAIVRLSDGVVVDGSATVSDAGGGWWRVQIPFTATAAVHHVGLWFWNSTSISSASGSEGVYVWGAQLETGSTATAYQRVTTAFDVTQAGVPDCYYLSFDGTDDWLQSAATINPGAVDKAQVFAGMRKLSDAAGGILVEASVNANLNAGSFFFSAPSTSTNPNYGFLLRGSAACSFVATTYAAPITNVLSCQYDIAQPDRTTEIVPRINGVTPTLAATGPSSVGTGNFLTYAHYIGRRAGSSAPSNVRLYQLITRYGANLTAGQITQTETFVNSKTGAY